MAWRDVLIIVGLVAGQLALPDGPWRPAVEVAIYLIGVAAIRFGIRHYRPTATTAWRALGAALTMFAVSSVAETLELTHVAPTLTHPLEAGLDVLGYAALTVAGVAAVVTGRARRDPESWVDAATLLLTAALAAAVWTDGAATSSRAGSELEVGLPLMTAVVLIAGVRLALPGQGRTRSGVALFVAGGLALIGYAGQAGDAPPGAEPLLDALPLLAVAGVALAARHPSMTDLGAPVTADRAVTAGRLVGLGASLLTSPVLVLLWAVRHGANGYLLGAGLGLLTALTLWRIGRLIADREHGRTELANSQARLQALLHHATDVIAIVDRTGCISYVSPAVEGLLGLPADHWVGRRALSALVAEDRHHLRTLLDPARATVGEPPRADVRLECPDGSWRWVEVRMSAELDVFGLDGWVVNLRDITERKLFETQLQHQAATDPLTGLANRPEFITQLTRASAAAAAGAGQAAVLFLDLDDFKTVNDRWGHATGDQLLVAVARRLRHCVRDADTVARLGGDEFAVVLPTADSAHTHQVADRILTRLRRPLDLDGQTIHISASLGGAFTRPTETTADLLHRADTAMYTAKNRGKNHYEILE